MHASDPRPPTSIPSSDTSRLNAATRASSSGPRQLPSITSLAAPFMPVVFVFAFFAVSPWAQRKRAKARICKGWSFSGRNWPTESTTGSRGVARGTSCLLAILARAE